MSIELRVPSLGESITEATVGEWRKKPGDPVAADEAVVVLETDKVTVDVQAPESGTLGTIAFVEGARVKIGDLLGLISPGPGKPAAQPPGGAAVGGATASVSVSRGSAPNTAPAPTAVARAMAADKGLDPAALQGSGASGRVMKSDVARASERPAATTPALRGEDRVRMTTLRRRVAERLLQAQSTAAILTTFNEVDLAQVMKLRRDHGERFEKKHGVKLGFMSFFVRAAVEALREFPAMNAFIDGDDVVFHHYYDVSVAVSGSRGLVVPVVRDADEKSMAELEKTIADLGARAKADKLKLEELQGGTFTISNGGIFGSMLSTPILNPPQTGILGMHAITERPVVREGNIVVRPMMYLALSYDHRLIDGREAVLFLVRVKDCLEAPERLLLEI